MTALFAVILAMVSIYIIGYPFLRASGKRTARNDGRRGVRALSAGPQTTYDMKRELESDYQSGILSRREYEELRGEVPQVAEKASGTGTSPRGPDVEDEIEEKVRQYRESKAEAGPQVRPGAAQQAKAAGSFPKREATGRSKAAFKCPKCGQPVREGDRFCTACGSPLKRGGGR
jgi:rubrerythrin